MKTKANRDPYPMKGNYLNRPYKTKQQIYQNNQSYSKYYLTNPKQKKK